MKTTSFFLGVLTIALLSFTVATYEPKNSTAEVEQEEGVYVFYR